MLSVCFRRLECCGSANALEAMGVNMQAPAVRAKSGRRDECGKCTVLTLSSTASLYSSALTHYWLLSLSYFLFHSFLLSPLLFVSNKGRKTMFMSSTRRLPSRKRCPKKDTFTGGACSKASLQ